MYRARLPAQGYMHICTSAHSHSHSHSYSHGQIAHMSIFSIAWRHDASRGLYGSGRKARMIHFIYVQTSAKDGAADHNRSLVPIMTSSFNNSSCDSYANLTDASDDDDSVDPQVQEDFATLSEVRLSSASMFTQLTLCKNQVPAQSPRSDSSRLHAGQTQLTGSPRPDARHMPPHPLRARTTVSSAIRAQRPRHGR